MRLPAHDRSWLLHGSERNEVLSLAEIEQYGLDSFGDSDYVSVFGMTPREWYTCGIRLLGRKAVECTRDALVIVLVAMLLPFAANMDANQLLVLDPFAGSCKVAPPWGTALNEQEGLDLRRTTPPISEIIEKLVRRFSNQQMLFAIQVS